MHGVGFEPTRSKPLELESNPLDQLGHPCIDYLYIVNIFFLNYIFLLKLF